MTYEELRQKLAEDKLVETGVGLVSEKTYNEIVALFGAQEADADDMWVDGIQLIKNPFIADGQIVPFERWNLGSKV